VVAGYLMEHGNLRVLIQPAELVTIGGAAIGTVLIANPLHILKQIAGGIGGVFGGSKFTKQAYLDSLKTLYDLLNKARKEGLMALEGDVEEPDKSPLFSKGPPHFKNHHVTRLSFATPCAWPSPASMPSISIKCSTSISKFITIKPLCPPPRSTAWPIPLPGLGIVAAVLGIVITMGALGGPPEEIGKKVAAALVGTFLESCSVTG
jgi:chemotaxis protein MotA